MHWLSLAFTSAMLLGLYNYFLKLASGHIHQIVGVVIMQIVTVCVGIICLSFLRLTNVPLEISSKGIIFAALSGFCVVLAEISAFYLFSRGVPASVGIPTLVAGSVIAGVVFGLSFSKETLSLTSRGNHTSYCWDYLDHNKS